MNTQDTHGKQQMKNRPNGIAPVVAPRQRKKRSTIELDTIEVRGAREHNLKHIDVSLPKKKLIVFTGVSGSGKSSLAFDTIFAEGQRRYVESLSAYARQFIGQMEKPRYDTIRGLSTDHLHRAKIGQQKSPFHGGHPSPKYTTTCGCCSPASASRPVSTAQSRLARGNAQGMVERILTMPEATKNSHPGTGDRQPQG